MNRNIDIETRGIMIKETSMRRNLIENTKINKCITKNTIKT